MELSKALKKRYIERQDARRKFNAAKKQNLPIKATQVPSEEPKLQTYFGMSAYTCTKQHRLKLFWSILGDCIDYRKEFYFQCENVDEANELAKLTYTLVFQYNDRWEVLLNDLVVKAKPPRGNAVPNTY